MKPIRLSGHARQQLRLRGGNRSRGGGDDPYEKWNPAEMGRFDCRCDFPFAATWNGKRYATKQVRPIFVEEAEEIVVVTVYVCFF